MSVFTYVKRRLFTPFELGFWSLFTILPTGLAIGAHLTPQDPPVPLVGWLILWGAVGGMWLVTVLFFIRRWRFLQRLKAAIVPPGLTVGWSEDRYAVDPAFVETLMNEMAQKMSGEYPSGLKALTGCLVFFREPTWIQGAQPGFIARKVAGEQDGPLIIVGWNEDLRRSALQHELAHRVLQVYASDPPEAVAHAIMSRLGVL